MKSPGWTPRVGARLVVGVGLVAGAAAQAADSLGERLVTLRSEVEQLSQEADLRDDDLRSRLRALEAQKAELEAQLRREELRLAQLRQAAEEQRKALTAREATGDALQPAVISGVASLRAAVRTGLPLRVDERLAELDRVEAEVRSGDLTPERAASQLWAFAEDELRLTQENALDRQLVRIDGDEVLVEVAHLGMTSLYFRTEDERVGVARRDGEGWRFEVLTDAQAREQVLALFDSLQKQVRVGFFTIPTAFEGGAP